MKISIIGLGWYGLPLAEQLRKKHKIVGTKSTHEAVAKWTHKRISPYHLNLNEKIEPHFTFPVFDVDAIVLNIPPNRKSPDAAAEYLKWMENLKAHISKHPVQHLVFISSTGVFSNGQGGVTENTLPHPKSISGKALYQAEKFFQKNFSGKLSIIRPGGLVGGDRHPAKFLAGRKDLKGGNHPVNLIHRDDLISLTEAVLYNNFSQKTFHAVANEHPNKKEFYTDAAKRLGLSPPAFDRSDLSTGKTIDNAITTQTAKIPMTLEKVLEPAVAE